MRTWQRLNKVAKAETRRRPTLVQLREWLTLIGAVVVVLLGGLLGGVRLVVAPLYTYTEALSERLTRMETLLERRGGAGPQEPAR